MVFDSTAVVDFARPWAFSAHHDTQEAFLFDSHCTIPSTSLLADWIDYSKSPAAAASSKTSVDGSTRSSATATTPTAAEGRDPVIAKTFRLINQRKFGEAKRYFASN